MCTLEKRGNLYILTLTGNDEHRLNPTLLDSLSSALHHIRSQTTANTPSALITTAHGNFFCNGYDLSWAVSAKDSPKILSSKLRSLITDLISLPMPTIAAVTGHASAAGFILALSHDYILMRRDRGVLYMCELDIGLKVPAWFVAMLSCKVGSPAVRRQIVLTAAKLRADVAVEKGIIDSAHDTAEETVRAAMELGEELVLMGRKWDGNAYAKNRMSLFDGVLGEMGFDETVEDQNLPTTNTVSRL